VCDMVQRWFRCVRCNVSIACVFTGGLIMVSLVVRMCVWHGLHMGQVCVVKCCGSVECGMVHMWFSSGSVVVHVYV